MPGLDVVEEIRTNMQQGASWLSRYAALGIEMAAQDNEYPEAQLAHVRSLACALAQVRPSMAAIASTVAHIWAAGQLADESPQARLAAISSAAHAAAKQETFEGDGMLEWGRKQAPNAMYTLSRSGSVERVLTALAHERATEAPLRVYVSESTPGGEGVELAGALTMVGASVWLAPDAACASLAPDVDLVLVGADSIRSDGSVVNKVGTHTLALAAQAAAKPLYVLAETLKITAHSYPLVIEHASSPDWPSHLMPGVTPIVPLFDVTPASLITAIVTEHGILTQEVFERLSAQAEEEYLALMSS